MWRPSGGRWIGLSLKDPRAFKAPKTLQEINFNRQKPQRDRLIMNLLTALVKHDVLQTTWFRARAISPLANDLVRLAKRGDFESEQKIRKQLAEPFLVDKILADFPVRFAHRNGYYVRVTPVMTRRKGDSTDRAVIEFEDRHRSLDRLYPPKVSHHLSPTLKTLQFKQRAGRWEDEDPNYDSVLIPEVAVKRHPLWEPQDDEVPGIFADARERKGQMRGPNNKASEWLEPDVTAGLLGDRDVYEPFQEPDVLAPPAPAPRPHRLRLREF